MTVTAEYQARPPMRPTHFFLIEVSQPAIASGATAAACSSLAKLLDELPGGERTQVGGWIGGWWVGFVSAECVMGLHAVRPGEPASWAHTTHTPV